MNWKRAFFVIVVSLIVSGAIMTSAGDREREFFALTFTVLALMIAIIMLVSPPRR